MSQREFSFQKEFPCSCGKTHRTQVEDVIIEKGAVRKLPQIMQRYRAKKAFVLSDPNTFAAAGQTVCGVLEGDGIPYTSYTFREASPEPDEHTVGSAIMHFDCSCDLIIGVGSGVINDTIKILSHVTGKPSVIVATAPSMDGYASATSSMVRDNLKVSLDSASVNVIIGDIDILKQAPMRMLQSGLGDMLAKYVSICEWRLSHLITGEYYCETIADMVRCALKKCTDHAEGLLKREDEAVRSVFEGLIIGGVAMSYAGLSRPASGGEHYYSHLWDMRALEFGTPMDFHGIQCAIATLSVLKLYENLQQLTPNREKALAYVEAFGLEDWNRRLRAFMGKSAEPMIALEQKEHKYDPQLHAARLEVILDKWEEILAVLKEELPSSTYVEQLLSTIGAPKTVQDIGIDPADLPMTFLASKDMRDKYVLSRLAWDLGVAEELVEELV